MDSCDLEVIGDTRNHQWSRHLEASLHWTRQIPEALNRGDHLQKLGDVLLEAKDARKKPDPHGAWGGQNQGYHGILMENERLRESFC